MNPQRMRILLICKGEYRYFFPAIARELKARHGCEVSAVAFTTPTSRMLEADGAFDQVFNLAAWLRAVVPSSNFEDCVESLRKFEEEHASGDVNTMLSADRIISRCSFEYGVRILAGIRGFWDRVLGSLPVDAILGEIACATEGMAWSLANRRGIPYLLPYPTPVANHFFFLNRPDGLWEAMRERFEDLKARALPSEAAIAAEEFIGSFRQQKAKPPFLVWAQQSPLTPRFRELARRAARVPFRIQTFCEDGDFEVGSYHGTPPWQPLLEDTARILRHIGSEAAIFDRHIASGPKIYFPLHVQPEFTTDVRAPFCTNQRALIESISKSMPVGYRLVVKEHPGMKGERKLNYYREIKKLPNVQLLSPSVDSHDLIQQSDAVVTITGSSAWEAILYEKPVISLGPLCYGFTDFVYPCGSTAELPHVLSKALHRVQPSRNLLLKFVWSFLDSAYRLDWGDPIRFPTVVAPTNVRRIAAAICYEISARSTSRVPAKVAV
jgi:Capsule polysaccharide biosynthesis protein